VSEVADRYADAVTFSFGDSPEMADELLALVLSGRKTATCGALRDFGGADPVPEVGRRDVVLDGRGRRAAVIETISVERKRFDEVDAESRPRKARVTCPTNIGEKRMRPISPATADFRRT
jgi:uncharacterized protein YhfF